MKERGYMGERGCMRRVCEGMETGRGRGQGRQKIGAQGWEKMAKRGEMEKDAVLQP